MSRKALLVLAALPLLAAGGCQEPEAVQEQNTTYVRKIAEVPGEAEIVHMEDERSTLGGGLKKWLSYPDPRSRKRAALAVGRLRERSLINELRALFADKDADVRASAAYAAGLLGDPALGPELERLIADPAPPVRRSAVLARGLLGGTSLPEPIRALLGGGGGDDAARLLAGEAALAVARFQDPAAAALLPPLLQSPDAEVRWRAAYSLSRLGQGGADLARLLHDPDPRVRAFAALGVGASHEVAAADDLLALLHDADTGTVAAAARALGALHEPRAAAALGELAHDPVPRRRYAAIEAMSESGLGAATLTEIFNDEKSPYLRALAVDGLRRAKAGREVINKALRDPEWRVRAAAARALADLGDTEGLAKRLQYDSDARVIPPVLEGLAKLGYRQLDTVLLKHLADKDPMVRATAARLIAGRHPPGTVEALLESYAAYSKRDEIAEANLAVIDALARVKGNDQALNPIKQAAMDNDWVLKTRAYPLLEGLGAAGTIEPPTRVNTLRTETYYHEVVSRGDYDVHLNLETEKGIVVFRLYTKQAPLNSRYLDEISQSGFFSDQPFSDMDALLELRGGDDRGDGYGHYPGWVRDEPHDTPFTKVQLTLGRPLGRDSGTSQLRITYLPRPELDAVFTPVGELIEGGELLDQLLPGDLVKSLSVTLHEFKGNFVTEKVAIERPVAGPAHPAGSAPLAGAASAAGPARWQLPPTLLYMAAVGGLLLLASLLPITLSTERREDVPLALWVIIGLIVLVAGTYTYLILSGDYFHLLTGERPGPRVLDVPNKPILTEDLAMVVCIGAMAYFVLELALLFFLVSRKSYARWVFVFLSAIEIALFTSQIATGLTLLSIVSQVGIVINLLKIWFLLMDRHTKEYLAAA